MRSRSYYTEALVIALKDYSESDRILVVYSKDFGKLSLIAKGVRKTGSKKRGHLEMFNLVKLSVVKTKGLDIVTEAEIINSFPKIRKNLKKVSMGYYFCEVVGKSTKDGEPHTEVFELLINYLERLENQNLLKELRMQFINDLLINLGFWPKGKKIANTDQLLEEVVERRINSSRVGKRMLS